MSDRPWGTRGEGGNAHPVVERLLSVADKWVGGGQRGGGAGKASSAYARVMDRVDSALDPWSARRVRKGGQRDEGASGRGSPCQSFVLRLLLLHFQRRLFEPLCAHASHQSGAKGGRGGGAHRGTSRRCTESVGVSSCSAAVEEGRPHLLNTLTGFGAGGGAPRLAATNAACAGAPAFGEADPWLISLV